MRRVKELNRVLSSYDRNLYSQCLRYPRIDIYRKSDYAMSPPHFLFALTDNWKVDGRPVEWGIELVLDRIRANDLWRDDSFVENYLKLTDKWKESKERDRKNNMESFLYDFRSEFHKATKDINTALLPKTSVEELHGYR